jgi:hypothetical protein
MRWRQDYPSGIHATTSADALWQHGSIYQRSGEQPDFFLMHQQVGQLTANEQLRMT